MDSVQIDLDLNGKELVMISLLANLGMAALAQDAGYGASVMKTIAQLDGADEVADDALGKLHAAMSLAEKQLSASDRTVWS